MMRRFDLPTVFVLSVLVSVSAPAQEALKPGFRDMKWGACVRPRTFGQSQAVVPAE